MNTETFDAALSALELIAMLAIPVLGWLHRAARAAISDVRLAARGAEVRAETAEKDLAAFRVEVARDYVNGKRMREMEDRLNRWLERIELKLDKAHGVGD